LRKLLLVSYYFPPLAGSGVFRPLRMSRCLPRHGWEVTVLTVSARARVLKDPGLVAEVPAGVRVERTSSIEPRVPLIVLHRLGLHALARSIERWFLVPDDQRGWVPFATRRGLRLHRIDPFDAVVSTAGPYSAHLVGRALHRKTGLPWVADFRDEWTTNPYLRRRYPTPWHLRFNQRLERSVLTEADRVVCVSAPWLETLRSLVPDQPDTKFCVHPNGYDAAHFPSAPPPSPDRFRIIYTGTFYGHRSPEAFLEALRRVVAARRVPRDELHVVFIGHTGSGPSFHDLSTGILRVVGQIPYSEALRYLHDAAVLLLVIPNEGGRGNHTGKLFDYLASGRPILALAPESNVAADLIVATRSGRVAPPDAPDIIADAIVAMYGDWKNGRTLRDQDRNAIAAYEADAQAERYARLLDEISGSRRPINRLETFSRA